MNAELKQQWVEALRSGKYQQGVGRLRTKDGEYCCLGVLGCIMKLSFDELGCRFIDKMDETTSSEYPQLPINRIDQNHLISMNDDDKASFSEIADYVEEHL